MKESEGCDIQDCEATLTIKYGTANARITVTPIKSIIGFLNIPIRLKDSIGAKKSILCLGSKVKG